MSEHPKTVPPKTVPWIWTIVLLALIPAAVAGVWLGGRLHRVDDRPTKVSKKTVGLRAPMRGDVTGDRKPVTAPPTAMVPTAKVPARAPGAAPK